MNATATWATRAYLRDPSHLACLQEIVDIAAPRTRLDARFDSSSAGPDFFFACPVGVQHWSRLFEWPWAVEASNLQRRDVVLEAGGGNSEFQFLLARYSRHVVNYDQAQEMLDVSEMDARRMGIHNVVFRRGQLESIYYPDNHFEKVFCISVIEHAEGAEACVDEMMRVLKPGGRLLLTMDIVDRIERVETTYLFDAQRAQRLLARWALQVPPFPADGLRQSIRQGDSNTLTVLCVMVQK
jgi:2-polyprenyl-3-methyl-5-hydroxy-6-metoxy-1,4-benzoquinol methylase